MKKLINLDCIWWNLKIKLKTDYKQNIVSFSDNSDADNYKI